MHNSKSLGARRALAVAIAAATVMPAAPLAAAQEQLLEEVVVTGSRIARDSNLTSVSPVQSISEQDIKLSGQLEVTDVLREQPALLTSTSSTGSVDGTFASSVGQNVLQLRGLGAERTLVLVDGRRHVSGVSGEQSVDVGSIPSALIERVEVLTGGASSIYGADAVTGVVNFILKDDFEGFDIDVQGGGSEENDGANYAVSGLFGKNLFDGRANFTIGIDASRSEGIRQGNRGWARDNGIVLAGRNNPATRFQAGDVGAGTPNFDALLTGGFGYPVGGSIPAQDDFVADYTAAFGMAPSLTSAEQALLDQASGAPARAFGSQYTFAISSKRGVIAPADFDFSNVDVDTDGNGVPDCEQSFVGSFFGCWVANDDGSVRPYEDGVIAGTSNQFGGDGIESGGLNRDYMTPDQEKISVNLTGRFDLTDTTSFFAEGKYVRSEVEYGGPYNSFNDTLFVAPDNPFIPGSLQQLANDRGGLLVTRDPTNFGDGEDENLRETLRFVAGFEGELDNGWTWELFGVYGKFDRQLNDNQRRIEDRYFAAIDATTDAAGNAICRSDVDPTPPETSPFPFFDSGFYTFTPGDGSCVPISLFAGTTPYSQAAVDWITTTVRNEFELTQTVFGGSIAGELPFSVPGASAIAFAAGAEYREEGSATRFDSLVRGVLPVDAPAGAAGTLVRDVSSNEALVFDPSVSVFDNDDEYDVTEMFGELQVPVLEGKPFAEELVLNVAGRISDYSTIDVARTWSAGVSWVPVEDLRLRTTVSEAVRAPNIFELFNPGQGAFFRPLDPCDTTVINSLPDGDPRKANRIANCAAEGIPAGYTDPLTGRFTGIESGNPDLQEETAETFTIGVVIEPRWVDGLTVSVDYWDIEIQDAIESVGAQDIVDNCYDAAPAGFPNQFCSLISRNPADTDPTTPDFGFNFLRQTEVNFGALEAAGVDFTATYAFDALRGSWNLGFAGTWMDKIDQFFDPADPTAINPELGEIQRPEWAGTGTISYATGPLSIRWQTMYQDEQLHSAAEIEDFQTVFGSAAVLDEFYKHDLSFSYDWDETIQVYGGVQNLTDEQPFAGEYAWPVSGMGRSYFVGVSYRSL